MSRRALFLDRDGVLDELVFYPSHGEWESPRQLSDLRLIEEAFPPLARAVRAGWLLFVVTNQPSYAKAKATREELTAVQDSVLKALSDNGAPVTESYQCFHHPDAVVPELRVACECRKPGTLFLREASREFNVDLKQSWMAGDQDSDLACGRAAGCRVALIEYPHSGYKRGAVEPDLRCRSIAEFVDHVVGTAR